MKVIKETITGMLLEDYTSGDIPQLEHDTSIFDKITHSDIPTSGFVLDNAFATYKMSEPYLRSITGHTPYSNFVIERVPLELGAPTNPYKSNIKLQKAQKPVAEKMMCGNNQVFLNIPTATGKTVLAVDMIAKLQIKTIVICHKKKILSQWYDTFVDKTDINPSRLMIINSCKYFYNLISGDEDPNDTDIWMVTPALLNTFCSVEGWDMLPELFGFMGIGFKVIDEAHRCFGSTIKINAYTSIRTLYLSADYNQTNPLIRKMFFKALKDATVIRYDMETMQDLKHITCVEYEFDTFPTDEDMVKITNPNRKNKYHWDHFAYTKYALEKGILLKHTEKIIKQIIQTDKYEGDKPYKILVLTNLIDAVDKIYDTLKDKLANSGRTISRYHTKLSKEETAGFADADIIISTYQAFGEGIDITTPCIKHVMSLNPVDPIMANQSAGRCRPIPNTDSFYWMMVDTGFDFCLSNETRVARYLSNAKIGKITRIEA